MKIKKYFTRRSGDSEKIFNKLRIFASPRLILLIISFTFIFPAFAQEEASITALCQTMVRHVPAADVVYKPSPDVVPADLNAVPGNELGSVYIPIQIDMMERYGLDLGGAFDLNPEVALVSVDEDGKVRYNGRDITENAQAACSSDGQTPPLPVKSEAATQDIK